MDNNKNAAPDPFEDNLRHILSNDTPSNSGSVTRKANPGANEPDEEAMTKRKAEERALLIFKILRPIAAVALLLALAMFVTRITGPR